MTGGCGRETGSWSCEWRVASSERIRGSGSHGILNLPEPISEIDRQSCDQSRRNQFHPEQILNVDLVHAAIGKKLLFDECRQVDDLKPRAESADEFGVWS